MSTTKRDPKEWVLDSVCTFHMCQTREYFSKLVDMSCQIKGIEKIKMLLNNYILELNNTRYVVELKRNLISLGQLDDKYTIMIHKGL